MRWVRSDGAVYLSGAVVRPGPAGRDVAGTRRSDGATNPDGRYR